MTNEQKLVNQKIHELNRKIMHERNKFVRDAYKDVLKYLKLKCA